MKRFLFILLIISLAACASPQATPEVPATAIPATSTLTPTTTNTPLPTNTPTATPIPEAFIIQNGEWAYWDGEKASYVEMTGILAQLPVDVVLSEWGETDEKGVREVLDAEGTARVWVLPSDVGNVKAVLIEGMELEYIEFYGRHAWIVLDAEGVFVDAHSLTAEKIDQSGDVQIITNFLQDHGYWSEGDSFENALFELDTMISEKLGDRLSRVGAITGHTVNGLEVKVTPKSYTSGALVVDWGVRTDKHNRELVELFVRLPSQNQYGEYLFNRMVVALRNASGNFIIITPMYELKIDHATGGRGAHVINDQLDSDRFDSMVGRYVEINFTIYGTESGGGNWEESMENHEEFFHPEFHRIGFNIDLDEVEELYKTDDAFIFLSDEENFSIISGGSASVDQILPKITQFKAGFGVYISLCGFKNNRLSD